MLLTVVAQNSQTTLGVFGDDDLNDQREYWTISTHPLRTADEMALVVHQLLRSAGLYEDDIEGIAVASAVPDFNSALREVATEHLDLDPVVVGPGVKSGIPILYDNPKEAGPDRIAAAVGALDRHGGPTIVVGFGTAITFDCVDEKGRYVGGAIAPGVAAALDGLYDQAAGLRRVELMAPVSVIARTTAESIQSGTVFGFADLVDGMCQRMEDQLGPCTVVATGAHAQLVGAHSKKILVQDPWIALWGLRLIWEKNQ
jgi:type III pantothenate kinase